MATASDTLEGAALQDLLVRHIGKRLLSTDPLINPYRFPNGIDQAFAQQPPHGSKSIDSRTPWIEALWRRWRKLMKLRESKIQRVMIAEAVHCASFGESYSTLLHMLVRLYPLRAVLTRDRHHALVGRIVIGLLQWIEHKWLETIGALQQCENAKAVTASKASLSACLFHTKCRLSQMLLMRQRGPHSDVAVQLVHQIGETQTKRQDIRPQRRRMRLARSSNTVCHRDAVPIEKHCYDDGLLRQEDLAIISRVVGHFRRALERNLPAHLDNMVQRLSQQFPNEFPEVESMYIRAWDCADVIVDILGTADAFQLFYPSLCKSNDMAEIIMGSPLQNLWSMIRRFGPMMQWEMARDVLLLYSCRWLLCVVEAPDHTPMDKHVAHALTFLRSLCDSKRTEAHWQRSIIRHTSTTPYVQRRDLVLLVSNCICQELAIIKMLDSNVGPCMKSRLSEGMRSRQFFRSQTGRSSSSLPLLTKILDNIKKNLSAGKDQGQLPIAFQNAVLQWEYIRPVLSRKLTHSVS